MSLGYFAKNRVRISYRIPSAMFALIFDPDSFGACEASVSGFLKGLFQIGRKSRDHMKASRYVMQLIEEDEARFRNRSKALRKSYPEDSAFYDFPVCVYAMEGVSRIDSILANWHEGFHARIHEYRSKFTKAPTKDDIKRENAWLGKLLEGWIEKDQVRELWEISHMLEWAPETGKNFEELLARVASFNVIAKKQREEKDHKKAYHLLKEMRRLGDIYGGAAFTKFANTVAISSFGRDVPYKLMHDAIDRAYEKQVR